MLYVYKEWYGGVDWHDAQTVEEMLKDAYGNLAVDNKESAEEIIMTDIMTAHPYLDKEKAKAAYFGSRKDGQYTVNIPQEDGSCDDSQTCQVKKGEICETYMHGQVSFWIYYDIKEIKTENVVFTVEQHFYAPMRGVPIIGRIYHEPFNTLEEAEAYKNSEVFSADWKNKVDIFVHDKSKITATDWFVSNMKLIELMRNLGQTHNDDTFAINVNLHKKKLQEYKPAA